jgi:hypothetical protein
LAALALPGPFERDRLLGLELKPGALDGARGIIFGSGKWVRKAAEPADLAHAA